MKKVFVYLLIGVVLILYGCTLAEPKNAGSILLIGQAKARGSSPNFNKHSSFDVESYLKLKIVNQRSGIEYQVTTDARGYFFIPNIEPGKYRITELVARHSVSIDSICTNCPPGVSAPSSLVEVKNTWHGEAWEPFLVFEDISYSGYYIFERVSDSGTTKEKVTRTVNRKDYQEALGHLISRFPDSIWSIMAKIKLHEL